MSSSKNDGKVEARFAARLDVLMERVDTLASTVASTASATAKKDGEIAALQKAFETRDETLRALVQHANRAAEAPPADVSVGENELRSLRNAVAALTKERASGVNAAHIENLAATVRAVGQKVEALSAAAAATPTTDPAVTGRIDALAGDLAVVKTAVQRLSEPQGLPEELVAMLSTLRDQVEAVGELRATVDEEHDRRFGATSDALATHSQRVDSLSETLVRLERLHAASEEQLDRGIRETGDALSSLSLRLDSVRSMNDMELDRRFEEADDARATLAERLEALAGVIHGLEQARSEEDSRSDRRLREFGGALTSLSQRLDSIRGVDEEQLDRRFDASNGAQAMLAQRLDALAETTRRLEQARADGNETVDRRFGTTDDALETLSRRLDDLRSVDIDQLDRRFATTGGAIDTLSQRVDRLAETVESAAASLGNKENELAALHRHFTDSSTRIESIVDDIREALHALPEPSSTSLDDLATRLERVETATRKGTESSARTAAELSGRIDVIDQRVATVAEEVSRAKTLWPVALRSLEARLDDAVHAPRPESDTTAESQGADLPADDLLAGLRDSLQAMETVAAEMARASETLGGPEAVEPPEDEAESDERDAEEPAAEAPPEVDEPQAAAAGGATIVPLRSAEP